MHVLDSIHGPDDLKALPAEQLPALAEEIRTFLVDSVSKTGGHLGPNLGVVELTIALHRVFDSPRDTIVFDTGHQSYVHKLLTGRHDFSRLKKQGGLSGYPSRAESEHDVVENSHASTALSWADGIAKARRLRGERDRHTVAVIGDGALTGGMAWEAINNIAVDKDLPLVIVVNDNEPLLRPDHRRPGRPPRHPAHDPRLRAVPGLGQVRPARARPSSAVRCTSTLHGMKKGLKDIVAPAGHVRGPRPEVPRPGRRPRRAGGRERRCARPGRSAARSSSTSSPRRAAATPRPATTRPTSSTASACSTPRPGCRSRSGGRIWTDEFSDEMVRDRRASAPDVVAITAAMLIPVGLDGFAARLPRPRLRRRHRRAARGDDGLGPRVRRAAPGRRRLRHLPQPGLRPAADGLRAAPRRRDLRARPRRRHRQRRRLAQRHVGHGASARSCRGCGWPRRATASRCAGSCARPSTSPTARPCCASPRATSPSRSPRSSGRGAVDVLHETRRPTRSTCSLVGVGAFAVHGGRASREKLEAQGRTRPRRRPALGAAGQRRPRRGWPARPVRWRSSRTTSSAAASARP